MTTAWLRDRAAQFAGGNTLSPQGHGGQAPVPGPRDGAAPRATSPVPATQLSAAGTAEANRQADHRAAQRTWAATTTTPIRTDSPKRRSA